MTIGYKNCTSGRVNLLEAALPLFAARGLRGTTTRAIADAAGLCEPALYAHFRNKRELFRSATVLASVARRLVLEGSWSGKPALKQVIAAIRDVYEEDSTGIRLACWGLLEDPGWTIAVLRREEAALARRLRKAGALNPVPLARLCFTQAVHRVVPRP